MVRGLVFVGFLLASAPAMATAERAAIPVSLRIEPSCAALLERVRGQSRQTIVCSETSMKRSIAPRTPAPYTLSTYRSGDRTVISIDF